MEPANATEAADHCALLDSQLAALDSDEVQFLTAMLDSNDTFVVNK